MQPSLVQKRSDRLIKYNFTTQLAPYALYKTSRAPFVIVPDPKAPKKDPVPPMNESMLPPK